MKTCRIGRILETSVSYGRSVDCPVYYQSNDFMDETKVSTAVCKEHFIKNVEECLKCRDGVIDIKEFDLVFFPVVKGGHSFCYCFDLFKKSMCILDNMVYEKKYLKKYLFVIEKLSLYLA